jgi:hypothetical protein
LTNAICAFLQSQLSLLAPGDVREIDGALEPAIRRFPADVRADRGPGGHCTFKNRPELVRVAFRIAGPRVRSNEFLGPAAGQFCRTPVDVGKTPLAIQSQNRIVDARTAAGRLPAARAGRGWRNLCVRALFGRLGSWRPF